MLELIAQNLAPIMFAALVVFLLLGYPVAFSLAAVIAWNSWPFFLLSYEQNEQSSNYGGLPQWPAKFLIPLAFSILFIQGISELIKRIAIMRGDLAETDASGHPAAAPSRSGHLEHPLTSSAGAAAGDERSGR